MKLRQAYQSVAKRCTIFYKLWRYTLEDCDCFEKTYLIGHLLYCVTGKGHKHIVLKLMLELLIFFIKECLSAA
jgi:hypothetical protein